MIEFTDESHDQIVVAKVSAKLTVADYQNIIIPKLDELIANYDKVSILMEVAADFTGWECSAMCMDFKYALKHRKDFRKIALVNAPSYVICLVKIVPFLVTAEIKPFSVNEREQALAWINA